jgi:hypothetical protein
MDTLEVIIKPMLKKFSFFNHAFLKNAFLLILSPKLFFNQGHIPPKNHKIPNHFFGLSLTIEDLIEDPIGVVEMCRQHKIRDVTLLIPSNRISEFSPTFMDDLVGHDIKFNLKLVLVDQEDIYLQWRELLDLTLLGYQPHIASIEIEMTSFSKEALHAFLNIWAMTFNMARLKKIKVAGPSMPSFSPFFNDMVFKLLKDKYQLPDIHTVNLTNEMDKEPELIYSNFLIPKLGKLFKFNLIKKLALIQRIAESFNIKTIYAAIELKRHEITSYTLRAISLLIASGRLTKLYLPYRNAEGILFLIDRMEGMTYLGALFHDVPFEIHHFKNDKEQMHAIWTRDDKTINPESFYHIEDIYAAKIYDSHGDIIDRTQLKITDTPIYLVWRSMDPIIFIDTPKVQDMNVTNIMALS